ncbi:MAG: type III-B CRISPR module-associated protein Cmr5 [Mariprofundaceae bacterium]
MPDLDQRRAAFAWQRVKEARKDLNNDYDNYKNLAKAAPSLIMNNGLMQTLAFFWSKGNEREGKHPDHHDMLRDNILAWLHEGSDGISVPREYKDAMAWLHGRATSEQYRLATEETMYLLRWLRQFADS